MLVLASTTILLIRRRVAKRVKWLQKHQIETVKRRMHAVFDRIDTDHSGTLDREEVTPTARSWLNEPPPLARPPARRVR